MFTEASLHLCDHKREERCGWVSVVCVLKLYLLTSVKEEDTSLRLHCKGCVVNVALCRGTKTQTLAWSVSLSSRWPGSIMPRGPQGKWAQRGAPKIHPSHRFPLTSVVDRFPDWLPFTAKGFLRAPCWSRRRSGYRQPGADRVKAVVLEDWVRRGEMCTRSVRQTAMPSFLQTS